MKKLQRAPDFIAFIAFITLNSLAHLRRFYKTLGVLGLVFCLQGCSLLQTTYNQASEITGWWIDGYVDLTSKQKTTLRSDLAEIHNWHRTTQLALYLEILHNFDSKLQSNLSVETVCSIEPELRARVIDLLVAFEPALTHLALHLKHDQWAHLQRKYDKNNKEWRSDWLEGSAEDRLEFRLKKDRDMGERLYGKLTSAQMTLLHELILESPFDPERTYAERLRRQADSLQVLRTIGQEHLSYDQARQSIHALLLRSTLDSPDTAYQDYHDKVLRSQCARAVKFHNAASEKQKLRAFKTIQSFEQDLTELMNKKN
jgi:hypothetical protein